MAAVVFTKTFTSGNLTGITVPVRITYPRTVALRRAAALRKHPQRRAVLTGAEYVVGDVRVEEV